MLTTMAAMLSSSATADMIPNAIVAGDRDSASERGDSSTRCRSSDCCCRISRTDCSVVSSRRRHRQLLLTQPSDRLVDALPQLGLLMPHISDRLLRRFQPRRHRQLLPTQFLNHPVHVSKVLSQLRLVSMYAHHGPCGRVREVIESANVRTGQHFGRPRYLPLGGANHTPGLAEHTGAATLTFSRLFDFVVLFHCHHLPQSAMVLWSRSCPRPYCRSRRLRGSLRSWGCAERS